MAATGTPRAEHLAATQTANLHPQNVAAPPEMQHWHPTTTGRTGNPVIAANFTKKHIKQSPRENIDTTQDPEANTVPITNDAILQYLQNLMNLQCEQKATMQSKLDDMMDQIRKYIPSTTQEERINTKTTTEPTNEPINEDETRSTTS